MVNSTKKEQKDNVILAIDGATKTGYAVYKNDRIIEHGTERFRPTRRCYDYSKWAQKMINKHGITQIVAEDIFREHSRTKDKAFYVLAKLHGVLEDRNERNGLPEVCFINPLMVKRFMIPRMCTKYERSEDKQRMINRVTHLGYNLESEKADDEADAIGILLTYLDAKGLPINHPDK